MRCRAITLLNKRCRCKVLYDNFCYIHMRIYHIESIVKIQSTWRSYITRRKIKNLYINLPYELQNLVLYFMREDHRVSQINKTYINIYNNKICKLNLSLSELYYQYQTIYTMDFQDYLDQKIQIIDKIKYFKYRISEIS